MKKNTIQIVITLIVLLVLLWFVIGPWMSAPTPQVPEAPERVAPN